MVISRPGSHLILSQPSVVSFFVRLLVGYFIKTQMNTQMYAFALPNTTVNHIRGCVVKILYPTLPRFQSKMAIVWDRSIAPPHTRRTVACRMERTRQTPDARHQLFHHQPAASRLKSRKSFMRTVTPLDSMHIF